LRTSRPRPRRGSPPTAGRSPDGHSRRSGARSPGGASDDPGEVRGGLAPRLEIGPPPLSSPGPSARPGPARGHPPSQRPRDMANPTETLWRTGFHRNVQSLWQICVPSPVAPILRGAHGAFSLGWIRGPGVCLLRSCSHHRRLPGCGDLSLEYGRERGRTIAMIHRPVRRLFVVAVIGEEASAASFRSVVVGRQAKLDRRRQAKLYHLGLKGNACHERIS
jgi:hypothetical protein